MVTTDFITGNGGNVQVDLKTIKDYAGNPLYRKGIMTDTWDIQPFQNAWVSKPFENLIRSAAEKANMNYHMDIGNNRLSNILKLRKLKDWGRGKLNDWSDESPKFIQFLDNIVFPKIKDLEIGKLVGGKPFTLEHPFYFMKDGNGNLITKNAFKGEKPFPYDVDDLYAEGGPLSINPDETMLSIKNRTRAIRNALKNVPIVGAGLYLNNKNKK